MSISKNEIDDSLYSRQRYVLGDCAMHKLAASNVFLFGLNGVGVEIAKNLILAGIKSITIHDNVQVSEKDMSCQFYVRDEDIKLSNSRSKASMQRLAELNVYVNVKLYEKAIDEESKLEFLTDFQCIIMSGCSLKLQLKVNNFCRQQSPQIKFIVADAYGLFCWTFCDFGDDFEVFDRDGEESKEVFIGSITKANPGVVTTTDSMMHGFETGDVVTFHELTSMQALNGALIPINVLSPSSFSILDTSTDDFDNFSGRGIVKKVKMKSVVHFKSLSESLKQPSMIVPDFGKPSSPTSILHGMLNVHQFMETHKRLPRPWNNEDCNLFISMAAFNDSAQSLDDEEKMLLKYLSFTCQGCLPPFCAFLGGVAAQEALKALSGKFEPLQQWLLLDAVELIKDSSKDVTNFQPRGDRYDDLRICIGEELCKKLGDIKVFMVGCGAIGCELLKNMALIGVGCGSGLVTITDNDLIEKSNLNRQFLFRSEHIQKPKSVMAAVSIHQINPKMNIVAQQHKVGWETEVNVYTDTFYSQLDVVVNALDNVEGRRYVDRRCVSNQKPLLESGTLSTKGHVQVIVPFLTESYNSQNDPDDSHDVPYCTLRSFPANMEHCIEWARDKFETLFSQRICLFNKFWKEYTPSDVQHSLMEATSIGHCKMVSKMACVLPSTWQECVSLARICFEKWFHFKAKELLSAFPLDTTLEDGSRFWELPKRPPTPIQFDSSNPLHMTFIVSYAKLMASVCGLKVDANQESIQDSISKTGVPPFEPKNKHIETSESATKPQKQEDSCEHEVQLGLDRIDFINKKFTEIPQLIPESFEKDDDSNGHIDFIASTANLRATMYGIAVEDRLHIKRIAGRIVPAIATTTAVVSALVTVELIKLVKQSPLEHFKNAFLNLAQNILVLSEPGPVRKNCMKSGAIFSIWDRWDIAGNSKMTLDMFMKAVMKKYKQEPTFIVQGTKLIFSSDMLSIHKKKLHQRMTTLLKITPTKAYVDLVVSYKSGVDEDESGPEVRYYLGVPTDI